MNKATRNKVQRKAAETVKARHKEPKQETAAAADTTPKVKEPKVAKPVVEGAMPKLPRIPSSSKVRKARPQQACSCGCGGLTTGRWVPGHDARARGWAIRIERELLKMSDVPEMERPGAALMLKERKEAGLTGKGISLAKGNRTAKAKVKEGEEKGASLVPEGAEQAVNE